MYTQEELDDITKIEHQLSIFPRTLEYQTWSDVMRKQLIEAQDDNQEVFYSTYLLILCEQLSALNLELETEFNQVAHLYGEEDKAQIQNTLQLRKDAVLSLQRLARSLTQDFKLDMATLQAKNDSWAIDEDEPETGKEVYSSSEHMVTSGEVEGHAGTHTSLFEDVITTFGFSRKDEVTIRLFLQSNSQLSLENKFWGIVSLDISEKSKGVLHIWWRTGIGYNGIVKRAAEILDVLKEGDLDSDENVQLLLNLFAEQKDDLLDHKVQQLFSANEFTYNSVERKNTLKALELLKSSVENAAVGTTIREMFLRVDKRRKIQASYLKIYLENYPDANLEDLLESVNAAISALTHSHNHDHLQEVTSESMESYSGGILSRASTPLTPASIPWMDKKTMEQIAAEWQSQSLLVGRLDVTLRNELFNLGWEHLIGYPKPQEIAAIFKQVKNYVRELRRKRYNIITWSDFFNAMHTANQQEKSFDAKTNTDVQGRAMFDAPMIKALEILLIKRIGLRKYNVVTSVEDLIDEVRHFYSQVFEG